MTHAHRLTADELTALIQRVFDPRPADRALAILVDLPDDRLADNPDWEIRRRLAAEWARDLLASRQRHGLDIGLYWYRNVRTNNADLPETCWRSQGDAVPAHVDALADRTPVDFGQVLTRHRLVMAPTELSATAPLKMLARRLGFRAATMPGFAAAMVPALRLDYGEVNRRVELLAALLDRATAAELRFGVVGGAEHSLRLDLRHRRAHASGGLLHEPGTAGNLPSGESYIVPYEGEMVDDPTTSRGELPVEMEGEVVLHRVADNRAVEILSDGPVSRRRRTELTAEPAAANLAELGLGVLGDFGIEPIGEVLLDEKLGLHIAFGRSDHFGGQVGPADFTGPEAVIHQDWVYLPQLQPRITPLEVTLVMDTGPDELLIRDGKWVVKFT